MTALDKDRNTQEMALFDNLAALEFGVDGGSHLFGGSLGMLNTAGMLVPGSADTSLIAAGRIEFEKNNTSGADGALVAKVKPGVYRWANGDAIDVTYRGLVCYVQDDQTVYSTDGGATRPKAGVIVDVDSAGVWVATGFGLFSNPAATPAGTLQKKTVTLTHGSVTATPDTDGTAFTVNVGTALPAGAVVVGAKLTSTTLWSGGGLASMTIQVGVAAGDLDSIIAASDVFTGAATGIRFGAEGDEIGRMFSGKQLVATLTPDGATKTSEPTAGATTVDVYYFVAF